MRLARIVLAGLAIDLLLACLTAAVLVWTGAEIDHKNGAGVAALAAEGSFVIVGATILLVAAIEEAAFRVAPVVIGSLLGRGGIIVACVASSAAFGYLHGGWTHIPVQGLGGVLYCGIYLYAGAPRLIMAPFIAVWAVHWLFDVILIYAAMVLYQFA